jgi:mannitol-specific phosphotransferase system IIBC component
MFSKKYNDKFSKLMKPLNFRFNVLHNSVILFFLLIISIFNLIYNGLLGNLQVPLIFALIGIITSFFSKNMIVILFISLITSNVIPKVKLNEGMENQEEEMEEMEDKGDKEKEKEKEKEKIKPYEKEENGTKVNKKKELEGMHDQYKELLTLQDEILGGISNLENSLKGAESIVEKMTNKISKV